MSNGGTLKTTVILDPDTKLMVSVLSGLFGADMKSLLQASIKVLYEYVKAYELPPDVAQSLDALVMYGGKIEKSLDDVVESLTDKISSGETFKVEDLNLGKKKKKK